MDSDELYYCRFCAERKTLSELHQLKHVGVEDVDEMLTFFQRKIDFSAEMLPKTLCKTCYTSLAASYKFFIKVDASQTYFEDISSAATFTEIDQKYNDNKSYTEEDNFFTVSKSLMKPSEENYKSVNNIETKSWPTSEHEYNFYYNHIELRGDCSWNSYPWFCKHCNDKFDTMQLLRGHCKDAHGSCYFYQCHYCYFSVGNFFHFTNHVQQHKPELSNFCPYCNIKMENQMHLRTHTEKPNCDICGEIFKSKELLVAHVQLYHRETIDDDVLNTATPAEQFLNDTEVTVEDESNNTTPAIQFLVDTEEVCNNNETNSENFNNSLWDKLVGHCAYCNIKVIGLCKLKDHVRDKHQRCFGARCVKCSDLQPFYLFAEYIQHVRRHNSGLRLSCEYCCEVFDNEEDTIFHTLQQHTKYPCRICGEYLLTQNRLTSHRQKYHIKDVMKKIPKPEGRTFFCEKCGKYLSSMSELRSHAFMHDSIEPQLCKICTRSFLSLKQLKKHIGTHLGDKPFECNECHRKFRTKHLLSLHMSVHTAYNKPFQCAYCEKTFRTKRRLDLHKKMHTGERPYSCKFCNKTFSCWGNCNKHMLRIHDATLAQSKLTPHGRMPLSKVLNIDDDEVKEWAKEVLRKGRQNT